MFRFADGFSKLSIASAMCAAAILPLLLPCVTQADPTITASVSSSINTPILQSLVENDEAIVVAAPKPVELGLATLSLRDVAGEPVEQSDYQNKKVVLYFWSMRCHGCLGPIKELQEMQEELKKENIELLTVHLFENDTSVLKTAFSSLGLRIPVMLAPNAVRDLFKVRLLPTSLVFNQNHELETRLSGEFDGDSLRLSILGKAPAELVETMKVSQAANLP